MTEFNPKAQILFGTLVGGNNSGEAESPASPGNSLAVDNFGNIYMAGTSSILNGFQSVVGSRKTKVFSVVNSPAVFLAQIVSQVSQVIGSDQFEMNDTSSTATNLNSYIKGYSSVQFPNLTTARHANGLFDYDWYRLTVPVSGYLSVTISNINVFASGPQPVIGGTGDLHLYVYQVKNGFMYQLGKSTNVSTVSQPVTSQSVGTTLPIFVTAGSYIEFLVQPYNYAQATYTLSVTLSQTFSG